MKTQWEKKGKETRMKESTIDQVVWDGKSKNKRSLEKMSPVFRPRATISARVDLGYILKSARSRGGHWIRKEASFSQLMSLLPLDPHLAGASPPERRATLSFAQGSPPLGSPRKRRGILAVKEV